MSLTYEILKRAVKLTGMKKRMEMSAAEIIAVKKKENRKNSIPDLHDDEMDITVTSVSGFPLVRMIHKDRTEKANLFLIGGGMVSPPRPGSLRKALKIAKESGVDLYVPYYPLCTDYPISKSFEVLLDVYREMLKDYEAEKISFLGTSSGAFLALGLIAHMNAVQADLTKPGFIIAISPGACPDTDEERQRMKELDKKDVLIPAAYMITAEEIMRHGEENLPDYMIHPQNGDYTGCPETVLIYGSDEVLYAIAPSYAEALQKYGVKYELTVGEGMFHCYPVFPLCPEAKEGWDLMIRLLKEA